MRRPIARDQNQRKRVPGSLVANWTKNYPAFTPLNLPGLIVWLDAADSSTITESGGFVSQWNDKSGNGYNVTQGIGANQPATGAATINGLNVLSFDGSNDRMLNLSVPSSSRPHTYVIVAKETAGQTATKSLLNATPFVSLAQALALFLTGTAPNRRTNIFTTSSVAGQVFTTTNTNVIYFKANGASSQFGINTSYLNLSTVGTTRAAGFMIGANEGGTGEFYNGQIAEILFFNSALTDYQRDTLTGYLRQKWAI